MKLEPTIEAFPSPTPDRQTDILAYVLDVQQALSSLVDQVAVGQETSSRIVEDTQEELIHQKEVADQESRSLDEHIKNLQAQYDDQEILLGNLRSELKEMTQRFNDEEKKHANTESNKKETIELKNQLHELEEARNAAKRHIEQLEGTLKEQQSDAEAKQQLQQKLEQRTLELTEQSTLLHSAQQATDSLKAQLSPLQQQLSEAQQSITPLQAELESVTASEATAQQELREVHKHVTKLNYALEEEKTLRAKAEHSLESTTNSTATQDSQEQTKAYQDRIVALETTEHAGAETILKLQEELKSSLAINTNGDEKLHELRAQTKEALDSDQEKDARIQFLEEKFAITQDTKNAQQSLHRELHEKIAELEKQLKDSLSENATLNEQLISKKALTHSEPLVELKLKNTENNDRLGHLLLKSGIITEAQLDEVLLERQQPNYDRTMRIGHQFINKGYVTEDVIAQAVAHQMDVPFLRIERNTIQYNAVRLVSQQLAEMHRCIPAFVQAGNLMLAMVNPIDLIAIEDIERTSGYPVKVLISTEKDIQDAIDHYYKKKA